jgi:methylthioribose-1-phosphate isomerase
MNRTDEIRPVYAEGREVVMLDQRLLPEREAFMLLSTVDEVCEAIRTMVVRGAPAIGIAAAFGAALAVGEAQKCAPCDCFSSFEKSLEKLKATRPTAVNLEWALNRVREYWLSSRNLDASAREKGAWELAQRILDDDVAANRALGMHGAELIPDGSNVLTHCNAGALATGGYGSALGVIRAAVEQGKKVHVWVDETRPRLQGAKLTAWELQRDGINHTLISDNMAASLMKAGRIDLAVTGADRIASNGDTANKIGTYSVAVNCEKHGLPFYVAAPESTIDRSIATGQEIPIEEREASEVTHVGETRICPEGVRIYNPAFDVTDAELIGAIVTEKGIHRPPFAFGAD